MRLTVATRTLRLALLRLAILLCALTSTALAQQTELDQDSSRGIFLIAKSRIHSGGFHQSVILVTPHAHGGTVGVVINRPMDIKLSEILPATLLGERHADTLYGGGPIQPEMLVFVFRSQREQQRAIPIFDDVFMSNHRPLLERLLAEKTPLRIFAGYAGWAPGQLLDEIDRGDWAVTDADSDSIFARDNSALWQQLSSKINPDWL